MANAKTVWLPIEHQIHKLLKTTLSSSATKAKGLLLMISGGADSLAMLEVMSRLQPALGVRLQVLYVHHGFSPDPVQDAYREQALAFIREICERKGLGFSFRKSGRVLESEAEMRDFRKSIAAQVLEKLDFDFSLWAHHQDDFLETQMLRLIRGSGAAGLLDPMKFENGRELRPLLQISRREIENYLSQRKLTWLEDPSNQDTDYLRNWMRHQWLPQLEEKCPGALNSFSRSLDLLRESVESGAEVLAQCQRADGLSRPQFLTLSEAQKKQCLALFLRQSGQKEFTHNQIKEIIKNMDISQTEHRFECAHMIWTLSKDLISATKARSPASEGESSRPS